MNYKITELSKYSKQDNEKMDSINNVFEIFPPFQLKSSFKSMDVQVENADFNEPEFDDSLSDLCISNIQYDFELTKYCPKCGEKYPKEEVICFKCLVHLKNISDNIEVSDIQFNPQFIFNASNSYDDLESLLCKDNLLKINKFDFTYEDYLNTLHDIKAQAFKNFDEIVKANKLDFDSLGILDKILLFAKSFVKVDYKSYGGQLGYFEEGVIYIDDRQTESLQITTLIHELSHFLIQEILIHILCKLLNASRNSTVQNLVTFILNYTPFTELIDEYAAHNVEGRFTLFGFQDYSSYLQIENSLNDEMSRDDIEITKTIGNSFALSVKEILESLIDRDLRDEIKKQFLSDVVDKPNYNALKMENCQVLTDEGFIKAIWLILNEGCGVALANLNMSQ